MTQIQERKGFYAIAIALVSVFALAVGFLIGWRCSSSTRYQLVVLPAAAGSQIDLDHVYRLDTKTGQIDWLAVNIAGGPEKTRTVLSFPAPSE